MNRHILVVGNGSAEQAITGKLIESGKVGKVSVAPGNVPIAANDVDGLLQWAKVKRPDLTVVGPLEPLAAGIVDAFQAENLRIFGPTKAAARIESSRVFAKQFMQRHNIPTAPFHVFDTFRQAMGYVLLEGDNKLAIKADGVLKGKDLYLTDCSHDAERAVRALMLDKVVGEAGSRIVIEEMLEGPEWSTLTFGGGMFGAQGLFLPIDKPPFKVDDPNVTQNLPAWWAIKLLQKEGASYVGILSTKLKLTSSGIKVIGFNAHLGDREVQAISRLNFAPGSAVTDLLQFFDKCVDEGGGHLVNGTWRLT